MTPIKTTLPTTSEVRDRLHEVGRVFGARSLTETIELLSYADLHVILRCTARRAAATGSPEPPGDDA